MPSTTRLDHPAAANLQEAADRALRSIIARLDRNRDWRPWFRIDLGTPARAAHDSWDYCDMAGRYVDAFARIRQVTGHSPEPEIEMGLRRFLLGRQNPEDGLFYNGADTIGSERLADMFCQGRALLGLCAWAFESGEETPLAAARNLARGLSRIAERKDGYAFYPRNLYRDGEWLEGGLFYEPKDLWSVKPGYGGTQLEGLMAYHALSGDETVVPFVAEYLRYFLGAARVVAEDGSYTGHLHSQGIVPTMVGAAMYAEATGDRDLLALCDRFLRFTLEQCSAFGWVPDGIGWPTCETCALADVIHLAIRLSRCGTGDYWPVVERFARNQLLQNQFIDPDRALTGRDPEPGVAEIVCGSFASWAKPNDLLGGPDLEGCCTQGGVRGLHLVLGNAVRTEPDGCVTVQMHFSLETGEVSVRSALPHTGYLAVTMKRPGALRLRLPEGCAPSSVCLTRDGTPVTAEIESHYLRLVLLPAGAHVEMTFPLTERREAVAVAGERYEVTWKGNTVAALTPEGTGYPTYRGQPQSAPPESAWPYAVQADFLPW